MTETTELRAPWQAPHATDLSPHPAPPQDVAALFAWGNLEGMWYRDFSASRRELRAQVREHAAELRREAARQAHLRAGQQALELEVAAVALEAQARQQEALALRAQGEGRSNDQMIAEAAKARFQLESSLVAQRGTQWRGDQLRWETAERAAAATMAQEAREAAEAHASAARQNLLYAAVSQPAGLSSTPWEPSLPGGDPPTTEVSGRAHGAMRPERFPSRRRTLTVDLDDLDAVHGDAGAHRAPVPLAMGTHGTAKLRESTAVEGRSQYPGEPANRKRVPNGVNDSPFPLRPELSSGEANANGTGDKSLVAGAVPAWIHQGSAGDLLPADAAPQAPSAVPAASTPGKVEPRQDREAFVSGESGTRTGQQ